MKNIKTLILFTIAFAFVMIAVIAFGIPGLFGIFGNGIILQWMAFGVQVLGAFLIAGLFIFIGVKITN